MATKQPQVTCGLRLGPTAQRELKALVAALKADGENPRREDVVGALLHRAQAIARNKTERERLAADARAHRKRAASEGF